MIVLQHDGRQPVPSLQLEVSGSHGRRSRGEERGDKFTQNLERGDCPPDFVMVQNFKHQVTCITI